VIKRLPIVHPFFFGIFPVLSLLSGNLGEAEIADALPVVAVTLAMVLALLGICHLLLGDQERAAVITSGFVLFFFAPFPVFLTLRGWLSGTYGGAVPLSMTPIYVALTLLIVLHTYYFARKAKELRQLNSILNIVSVALAASPTFAIAVTKLSERIDDSRILAQQQSEKLVSRSTVATPLPDIYYLVMDRYAGPDTLKTIYHFDNRDFLAYLESQGFYVAAQSAANYPTTDQSLASSLNLQYLDYLKELVGANSTSWLPIRRLLKDHRVGHFLKSKGYHYIHLGSWWEPTRQNSFADQNVYFTRLPEMFYAVYGTTMFQPVSTALGVLDFRYGHWQGNRRQFENLFKTVEARGPKFVFAHFLLPHEPYVFGRTGEYLPMARISAQPEEISYIDQLVYANRMLQQTIDALLRKSQRAPLIILQADEGPYPRRYRDNSQNFDWQQATDAEINQKMKILNAFYLPGNGSRGLYPTISPVNAFRVVFNTYFGTDLPLLRDESFVFQKQRHPYDLVTITPRLKRN